jgi:hypothetical protein
VSSVEPSSLTITSIATDTPVWQAKDSRQRSKCRGRWYELTTTEISGVDDMAQPS